jgi:hypothetical protein
MKFVLCVVLLAAFLGHFAAEAYIARSSASSVGRDLPKEQWYTQVWPPSPLITSSALVGQVP